jgi:hypothetical protein
MTYIINKFFDLYYRMTQFSGAFPKRFLWWQIFFNACAGLGFPVSHVFLVSRNTKLNEIHHQFCEISHVSRNNIISEILFCFITSKISFCFAKFHLVSLRFADIQSVSFRKINIFPFCNPHLIPVLRSRIIFMRIRVKILIRLCLQLLPYCIERQNF